MTGNADPASTYTDLRETALHVSPDKLGLSLPVGRLSQFGIVMEMGYPKGTVTVVSYATGDASIYLSTGGGVIGGMGHEAVKASAKQFVNVSGQFLMKLHKVSASPQPAMAKTIFYVLTNQGLYASDQIDEDELGNNRSELSPLFHAGQNVITQLRLVSPP